MSSRAFHTPTTSPGLHGTEAESARSGAAATRGGSHVASMAKRSRQAQRTRQAWSGGPRQARASLGHRRRIVPSPVGWARYPCRLGFASPAGWAHNPCRPGSLLPAGPTTSPGGRGGMTGELSCIFSGRDRRPEHLAVPLLGDVGCLRAPAARRSAVRRRSACSPSTRSACPARPSAQAESPVEGNWRRSSARARRAASGAARTFQVCESGP